MEFTNENELWAHAIVDELAKNGLRRAVVCPGSRNTPLTVALQRSDPIKVDSLLDERSATFLALGQGKQTGDPTAVFTTSGTATAECHPAVLEAHHARVPLLVITADRPAELLDSGANQTIDQTNLYGDAVRWSSNLPEAEADGRKLRSLRTTVGRAVRETTGPDAGPVHLNVPFRKPLEPTPDNRTIDEGFLREHTLEVEGRDGPFVHRSASQPEASEDVFNEIIQTILDARRGWILAGPRRPGDRSVQALQRITELTGFPLLADPLSGLRFRDGNGDWPLLSGYDGYLAPSFDDIDPPELVLRFGANPTPSKRLNRYLGSTDARQVIVDPAGRWPEDQFKATDLVETTPESLATALADADRPSALDVGWTERWVERDGRFWDQLDDDHTGSRASTVFEPDLLNAVVEELPSKGHLFVGNSLPIRDLVQFVSHRTKTIHTHANRGCSGIDGIVSSALGVDRTTDHPLVAVVGDVSFYHDMNGLMALERLNLNATVVVINNDGGGIFHRLPIEDHDPPFTGLVKTPHGLTYESAAKQFGCRYYEVDHLDRGSDVLTQAVEGEKPTLIEFRTDGEKNERLRERVLPSLD